MAPGDRPLAAFDRITPGDQRDTESVNTRAAREVSDEQPASHTRPGRMVNPTGEGGADVDRELIADETDDDSAPSPEEAAMHLVEEDEEE